MTSTERPARYPDSPAWTKDLIIYEIATKGFTSPDGPESGTFRSLEAKLPYLHDLGINAIWLTGHSWSDPRHFYNIWTQYATIDPGVIDPSLGTEQDFKDMIASAHEQGIRVFLDVITHGVMKDSPLVAAHPDWFRGESWGMIDYDFDADIPELDQWWVDVWTRYAVEFGVDGFRLDLGLRRPDLWAQIRANAAAVGHPIVLINETEYAHTVEWVIASGLKTVPTEDEFLGLIDFAQRDSVHLLDPHHKIEFEPLHDYGRAHMWTVEHWAQWLARVTGGAGADGRLQWAWPCVQLSCHDDGWEDFAGDNPYVAQGSRFVWGYGALFSGMVPIFMAGEEFGADYVPLPTLSPRLFGGDDPGKGTWLYGSMIQWDQLDQPEHRAVLDDVTRLIAIRKQEADILAARPTYAEPNLLPLAYEGDIPVPQPYLRWADGAAILVAGNPSTEADVSMTVSLPLDDIGLGGHRLYNVRNLWTGTSETYTSADLLRLVITIPRDKTPGGGLRLLKIQPA